MSKTADLVRISSAIMGHPRRASQINALAARLTDFAVATPYRLLPGEVTLLRSAAAAWAAAAPDATHHVVFQDDVMPHPGLHDAIIGSVALRPAEGIAFFCEWGCKTANAVRLAAVVGCHFAEIVDKYVPTNSFILPAAAAMELSHWLAAAASRGTEPDDVVVRAFTAKMGIQCLVTVPNLVDDLGLPSLAGNDTMGPRRSACPPAAGVALPPPSGKELSNLTLLPFFQWRTGQALVLERAAPSGEWTRAQLAPLVAGRGLTPGETTRMVTTALGACAAPARRALAQASPWLPELAMVVVALVMCVAGLSPQTSLTARFADPVVRAGWESLVPGTLRCLAPACAADDCRAGLFAFTATLASQAEALLGQGRLEPIACTGQALRR